MCCYFCFTHRFSCLLFLVAVIHPSTDSTDGGGGGTTPRPPTEETVDLTPFGLLYDLADGLGTPSSEDYGMVIDVTMGYLNTYMSLQYEGQGLEEFQTVATSTIYRAGVPQIDYTASATFKAANIPSMSQLDDNVARAFSGANLSLYLSMLQNLPDDNAFSTTSGARLTNPADMQSSSRSSILESVSTAGKAGIIGAIGAGGLIIFAIGFTIFGNKQRRTNRVGERTKLTLDRRRTEQESTTCSSSTDGSRTEDSASHLSDSERISLSTRGRRASRDPLGGDDGLSALSEVALNAD